VATAGLDRAVSIWDLRAPNAPAPAAQIPAAHAGEASAVAWHPGGAALASGGADGAVKLWDARRLGAGGGQLLGSFVGHVGGVAALEFSPDGEWLLSAGADACLCHWRVAGDG
jgi:WD40 repeat protein